MDTPHHKLLGQHKNLYTWNDQARNKGLYVDSEFDSFNEYDAFQTLEHFKGMDRIGAVASAMISKMEPEDLKWFAINLAQMPKTIQNRIVRRFFDNEKKGHITEEENKAWLKKVIEQQKGRFEIIFNISHRLPIPWHILSNRNKTTEQARYISRDVMQTLNDIVESSDRLKGKAILAVASELSSDPESIRQHKKAAILPDEYEERVPLIYDRIGFYMQQTGVAPEHWVKHRQAVVSEGRCRPPTIEQYEHALLKVQCEKWWRRKLKRMRGQYLELLEIATGQVGTGDGANAYASAQALAEYKENKISGQKWLEMMELESDQGEVIDLLDAVNAGVANPINRRNEAMLRIRAIEEYADDQGDIGMFYTMTCPRRYHANSAIWHGESVKDAQSYLCQTWADARAALAVEGITLYGMRVAEPHKDGCPHWHMLVFMKPELKHKVNHILRHYFCQADRAELIERYKHRRSIMKTYKKARQAWGLAKSQKKHRPEPKLDYTASARRFTIEPIDKKKGSAVSYIAKYISKNLTADGLEGKGLNDHIDHETGKPLSEQINPVLAWASVWNIRQFQFLGSPPVTVYRELRRVREEVEDDVIEPIRQAADTGDFKAFINYMGGMCIGRDSTLKTDYRVVKQGSSYGEDLKKIAGVVIREDESRGLNTRVTEWVRQLKGTANSKMMERPFVGEANRSWTSGNNCNRPNLEQVSREVIHTLKGIGFDEKSIEILTQGGMVWMESQYYGILGGELRNWPDTAKHSWLQNTEDIYRVGEQSSPTEYEQSENQLLAMGFDEDGVELLLSGARVEFDGYIHQIVDGELRRYSREQVQRHEHNRHVAAEAKAIFEKARAEKIRTLANELALSRGESVDGLPNPGLETYQHATMQVDAMNGVEPSELLYRQAEEAIKARELEQWFA